MSVDTDVGFWKWLFGSVISLAAGLFGYHKYIEAKLDKKADKHTVNTALQTVNNELGTLRGTQAKIFDHMREDRDAAEQRHREVLMHLLERK